MSEVLHAFGIDWRLIVIQVFNFAILIGVLWYFLYTPVLKIISERQKKIEEGVHNAEKAEQSLSEAGQRKQKILTDAEHDAHEIVMRAKVQGEEKESHIVTEAQDKARRIIENATQKGEEAKELARKESDAEIARAAVLAAEKVLREQTS